MKAKWNLWLPILLMLVFALTRWPGLMPPNFSAAYALAFCAGVYFPKRLAWWLPLATMAVTDILLNVFAYKVVAFNGYTLINLLGFAALIGLGRALGSRTSWFKLISGGLLGAILFYLLTNTAAWIYESTQPYPKTFAGWLQALSLGTQGWPETWTFFRNTLLSSGLFTGLFVGSMKLAAAAESAREKETPEAKEAPPETEPAPEEAKA